MTRSHDEDVRWNAVRDEFHRELELCLLALAPHLAREFVGKSAEQIRGRLAQVYEEVLTILLQRARARLDRRTP